MTVSQKFGKKCMESAKRRYSNHYLEGQLIILERTDVYEKNHEPSHR